MVGGFENKSGSNYSGIILGGCKNQLINTCNTSIIGGRCNKILGRGMFMYKSPYEYGEYFGPNTVYDSFILGGGCNKFGALSYLTYNPTGARRIKNSGIIGGCCNNVYSCNPGPYFGLSDLDGAIIIGGCGITASSRGMHIQNLLVCGTFRTRNSNYSCTGFSGTVANPTSIRVVNGLVVNVT
jgi:hypothetical protein